MLYVWAGKGTQIQELCKNPKNLHLNIVKNITEFGLVKFRIKNHNAVGQTNILVKDMNWTMVTNIIKYKCYQTALPKDIVGKGIEKFYIDHEPNSNYTITFHGYGAFNTPLPKVDCPLSKGNQAPHPKFERSNGKILKSKFFLTSVKELVRPAHLKAQ